MRRLAALSLVLGSILFACSGDDNPGASSVDASSPNATTQTVGASGGTVAAGSISLSIPPGALDADVSISITAGGEPTPAGYTALSQLYTFGPDGTHFLKPITVTFTLVNQGTAPTIYWSNVSGGYDALATTVNGTSASASIDHFSHAFCGERKGKPDAGNSIQDAGVDDANTEDASTNNDSGTTGASDSGADASANDADSGGSDSGESDASDSGKGGADAGASDGGADGAADAGSADAAAGNTDAAAMDGGATDGGAADSGANDSGGDAASAPGLSATVDGTPTTFAVNQLVTLGNGTTTIRADDNATATHWTLQMITTGIPQEVCQPNANPVMTYTHYTNGSTDALYSSQITYGTCTILMSSKPVNHGDHAKGTFSATLERANAPLNSPVSHAFAVGTFDLVY